MDDTFDPPVPPSGCLGIALVLGACMICAIAAAYFVALAAVD